jgi:hypothetical protein
MVNYLIQEVGFNLFYLSKKLNMQFLLTDMIHAFLFYKFNKKLVNFSIELLWQKQSKFFNHFI